MTPACGSYTNVLQIFARNAQDRNNSTSTAPQLLPVHKSYVVIEGIDILHVGVLNWFPRTPC
jgi:hypothetical protein